VKHLLTALLLAASAHAEDGTAFFEAKVLPLLRQRCYECHSHESKIKGGLALDSKSGWQTGGDHGAAITPGNVSKSLLVEAVRYTNPDMEMPPKGKLAANEIEVLEKWVAIGAPDRRSGSVVKASGIDIKAGKQFWAFQPVRDSHSPAVKNVSWPVNDVDRFILAKQESAGLTPAPDAEAHTWLRRVYLDLTGLPPTTEEISSFVTRHSSFESVVDKLLASPAFGERWARHWLDLTG
jgi:hypothetical protein